MLKTTDDKVQMIEGMALIFPQESEVPIISFQTFGTCFPARSGTFAAGAITFRSSQANKVYIDYSDGTGEHEYTFTPFLSEYWIRFYCAAATTPAAVAGSQVYDVKPNDGKGGGVYGIHFYQDLVNVTKINTVDHAYSQARMVRIRFEKINFITSASFEDASFKGEFPSLARLRNLITLSLIKPFYLTSFNNQAIYTLIRNVTLDSPGFNATTVPLWIKQSPTEALNLSNYIVLSGVSDFLSEIMSFNNLKMLTLDNCNINYQLPEVFSQRPQFSSFRSQGNTPSADEFKWPEDLSQMGEFKTLDLDDKISFPLAQIKRFIQEVPSTGKEIKIRRRGSTVAPIDIVLGADDYSVEIFSAPYSRWNNGVPPTCVNQMRNLKRLILYGIPNATNTPTQLLGWGNFANATNIERIEFHWSVLMDVNFPAWVVALKKLKYFSCDASLDTLQKANSFVDSVYSIVTANASISVGNTPFRQMTFILWGSQSNATNSKRPSGTYQQPAGYVQGSNNGTPASALEKIWVLTKQYGHTWTLPAT